MKFGQTYKEIKKTREPHFWFAWHPVSLEDGRFAWLETVEREYSFCEWIYRSINE